MRAPTYSLGADGWSWQRQELHGEDVIQQFEARGWCALEQSRHDHHAVIDQFSTPTVAVRRVWHTPLDLARTPHRISPLHPAPQLWMQVDGELLITPHADVESPLPSGSAFFHTESVEAFRNTEATARFEIQLARRKDRRWETGELIGCGGTSTWSALAGVINAVLNAREAPSIRTLALQAASVDVLADALWFESLPILPAVDSRPFARALELITDHACDPTFTIETLAGMLGLTRTHVTRLFRQRGEMPSRVLKRERLRNARKMLAIEPTTPLETVAESCGFTSTRQLRECLRDEVVQDTRATTLRAS